MLEDRLLLRRFKNGNSEALSRIYTKYENHLLALAASLLGDVHSAEDLVHDVFSSFIQSRQQIRQNGSLKSFLSTCVVNRARDKIRTGKSRAALLEEANFSYTNINEPDQDIIYSEKTWEICRALAQLPYDQREVIVMHLTGDMKFREIAVVQNESINTVKSRYRYGLEKLRALLKSEDPKNETG